MRGCGCVSLRYEVSPARRDVAGHQGDIVRKGLLCCDDIG